MVSSKEISRLYFEDRLSIRQIAKKLNQSPSTIRHRILTLDKDLRSQIEGSILRTTDEYREKLSLAQAGEKARAAKLKNSDVLAIRREYQEALQLGKQKTAMQFYLAKKYGVKRPTISDIVLRKTWKHI